MELRPVEGLKSAALSEITPFREKLCSDLVELKRTVALVKATGAGVRRKGLTQKRTCHGSKECCIVRNHTL